MNDQAGGFGPSALMTPANLVTLGRIAAAPVAFAMLLDNDGRGSWALLALWFVLSATDFVDGYLARKQGSTRSGAFLDPLADKVLVLGGFVTLAVVGRFPWVAVVLTIVRELGISGFRSYWGRRGLSVPASELAKWKTFIQLGAVGWVTWPTFTDWRWLSDSWLWAGVVIAWVTAVQYVMAGSRATSTTGESAKT
ncbi:MAG: CDP-alcohol phosphatidyltransferase family protein [Microthrixaceae bacterium]